MVPPSFRRPPAGKRRLSSPSLAALALLAATHAAPGCAAESSPPRRAEPSFALPAPRTTGAMSVEEALSRRRSLRDLLREPLAMEDVGQLLWSAQGVTEPASGYRASPSAGALYPLEAYAVTADGVFHYLPQGHRLERVLVGDLRGPLARAALGQAVVEQAAVDVVLTGVVARTRAKYGDRAERFVHMEAGHAGQNILLQATALGLGAAPVGGFPDEAVRAVLALPADEIPLYILAIGRR